MKERGNAGRTNRRIAMTPEAYEQHQKDKLQLGEMDLFQKVAFFDAIQKMELGEYDWIKIVGKDLDPASMRNLGRTVKQAWPEWKGHVLFMDVDTSLEAMHWMACLTHEDVETVLQAMHEYYGRLADIQRGK